MERYFMVMLYKSLYIDTLLQLATNKLNINYKSYNHSLRTFVLI